MSTPNLQHPWCRLLMFFSPSPYYCSLRSSTFSSSALLSSPPSTRLPFAHPSCLFFQQQPTSSVPFRCYKSMCAISAHSVTPVCYPDSVLHSLLLLSRLDTTHASWRRSLDSLPSLLASLPLQALPPFLSIVASSLPPDAPAVLNGVFQRFKHSSTLSTTSLGVEKLVEVIWAYALCGFSPVILSQLLSNLTPLLFLSKDEEGHSTSTREKKNGSCGAAAIPSTTSGRGGERGSILWSSLPNGHLTKLSVAMSICLHHNSSHPLWDQIASPGFVSVFESLVQQTRAAIFSMDGNNSSVFGVSGRRLEGEEGLSGGKTLRRTRRPPHTIPPTDLSTSTNNTPSSNITTSNSIVDKVRSRLSLSPFQQLSFAIFAVARIRQSFPLSSAFSPSAAAWLETLASRLRRLLIVEDVSNVGCLGCLCIAEEGLRHLGPLSAQMLEDLHGLVEERIATAQPDHVVACLNQIRLCRAFECVHLQSLFRAIANRTDELTSGQRWQLKKTLASAIETTAGVSATDQSCGGLGEGVVGQRCLRGYSYLQKMQQDNILDRRHRALVGWNRTRSYR
eukprot:GHVS01026643.1.p1 GENE.GHVS01026643.1~~GHVS01026643.1.p1  ORF type:complete len:563 (-),score=105.33 GHVS01026643.1:968-2656(-)